MYGERDEQQRQSYRRAFETLCPAGLYFQSHQSVATAAPVSRGGERARGRESRGDGKRQRGGGGTGEQKPRVGPQLLPLNRWITANHEEGLPREGGVRNVWLQHNDTWFPPLDYAARGTHRPRKRVTVATLPTESSSVGANCRHGKQTVRKYCDVLQPQYLAAAHDKCIVGERAGHVGKREWWEKRQMEINTQLIARFKNRLV